MHNPALRHIKKHNTKATMHIQKELLKTLVQQGITTGQAAWFFNYALKKEWK